MKPFVVFLALLSFSYIIYSQVINVDINPSSKPKGSLMLSEIVEYIEYVPLETNDDCVVGQISYFDISDNYIAISVYQTKEVFLFSRTGRFITKIGKQGQSGSEYLSPGSVYINELMKCIYVRDGHKVLVYDFSGKYVTTFSTDNKSSAVFMFWNNHFLTGKISVESNENYYVYGIWDDSMKLVKQAVKGVPVEIKGQFNSGAHVNPSISYYIYKGYPHVKESVLNDTIYQINNIHEFIPKYIINCGRYGMTAEIKGDTEHFFENFKKYIGGMFFFETSNYLLSKYSYNGEIIVCYLDKKTSKLLYFDSNDGIPDDYAGGISFWPMRQVNNSFYAFYNSYDLLNNYSKQKKIAVKGPSSTVLKVQSLIKKLDTEDNPVLIIVRIKE